MSALGSLNPAMRCWTGLPHVSYAEAVLRTQLRPWRCILAMVPWTREVSPWVFSKLPPLRSGRFDRLVHFVG